MKLLVIGGTGPLGLETLKRAIVEGHEVTALVRRPNEFTHSPAGVNVVQGDVMKPETLKAGLAGQDCVISALGSKLSRKPTTLLSHGTKNVVMAMKAQNVGRLICVTGIGAGDSIGHGGWLYDHVIQPLLLKEIYKDKTRQEMVVRDSGLKWVIVRPAQLTNGAPTGHFRVETNMAGFTATKISRADVADFLLKQVTSDAYLGKSPVICY